jgi:hypothetical protein
MHASAIILIERIHKFTRIQAGLAADVLDIRFRQTDEVRLFPELRQSIQRDQVLELLRPLMMAAGAASLATKSDIIKSSQH